MQSRSIKRVSVIRWNYSLTIVFITVLLLLNYRKRNGHKRWRKVAESETMLISRRSCIEITNMRICTLSVKK